MLQRKLLVQRYFALPDLVILLLIATAIYGVVAISQEWQADFQPVTEIHLSASALPYYTLLSGIRGFVAYFISLFFTLVVGYAAAKSKAAEKIIIPLLDILQSVPVLGFLPGLILGLVAIFPNKNTGLELAAILMIFTGQVWNMTFSYYASLKSVPRDLVEASTVMGFNWTQKMKKVELPYSAVNLAWNSVMSMAGGWFFLIPCEAMTLGDQQYRLPGIGAYMDMAVRQGDTRATVLAVFAMVALILIMDVVIWRPILAWVQKFRLEQLPGAIADEPLMQIWLRESRIVRWLISIYRDYLSHQERARSANLARLKGRGDSSEAVRFEILDRWMSQLSRTWRIIRNSSRAHRFGSILIQILAWGCIALIVGFLTYFGYKLGLLLWKVEAQTWWMLLLHAFQTMGRVFGALFLSTLWAVPVGIWIGTSPSRIRIAQPIIQVLASFPAPMLYPLVLTAFFTLGISFGVGSMFLMLLGVQWYVLFNVLAGALRIPRELIDAMSLMETSRWDRWRLLYIPSIFPALATGWVTAAGGAWNASVVAEYIAFQGRIVRTDGLGSDLSVATAAGDFTLFSASLTLMVFLVILLNRTLWTRIYHLAQTRFRMEI